ncbi:hypothetical protein [Desulfosporosinus sp. SB140]|uniref:hypothetical protein n=1 Tax=Desulfosporosinus paludis TaxID=3115649 RepID=UPI00388F262F
MGCSFFSNPTGEDENAIFNTIVKKDLYFKYRNEFRLYSHYINLNEAERFYVGNLHDITEVFETNELFFGKEIVLKVDWNYCATINFDRTNRDNMELWIFAFKYSSI